MSRLPTVLLIDDGADDRTLIGLVLRGAFGEVAVEEAADAPALVRAMTAGRFGLVITEHTLPWIRAADTIRLVRDLRPGVPVVVLTARPLAEAAADLVHLGPDALVPKTSTGLSDLPSVLRRVLHDSRRRRGLSPAEAGARRLLDGLPAGVLVASRDGDVLEANPALAALLGYADPAECTQRPLGELFAVAGEGESWLSQVRAATAVVALDAQLRRRDGSHRLARISGWNAPGVAEVHALVEDRSPLEDATGAPSGAPSEPAEEADEAAELAYVVSHDLRQPLTQIARYLKLIEEDAGARLGRPEQELLAQARRSAGRLETLVDGVVRYAGVAQRVDFAPVALEEVLARVLERLAEDRAAAAAEVTHDPLPTLEASAPQMDQLFQNLLANALKFRGDAPARVHICAQAEGELWHFRMRDHGIGIDPKDARRVFGLFQRLHTEQEVPGSGIGLALCKRIVGRHGGRIWVESRPGAGATFHWTLARNPAAGPARAEE